MAETRARCLAWDFEKVELTDLQTLALATAVATSKDQNSAGNLDPSMELLTGYR